MSDDGVRRAAPGSRYGEFVEKVTRNVVEARASLPSETRRAIVTRDTGAIPQSLRPYVLKVALHAYRVEDDDITGLKREGLSEDEIFEVTVSAALGAALLRLEKGMSALRGATDGGR